MGSVGNPENPGIPEIPGNPGIRQRFAARSAAVPASNNGPIDARYAYRSDAKYTSRKASCPFAKLVNDGRRNTMYHAHANVKSGNRLRSSTAAAVIAMVSTRGIHRSVFVVLMVSVYG